MRFVLLLTTFLLLSISAADAQTYTGGWAGATCVNLGRGIARAGSEATSDFYRLEGGFENTSKDTTAFVGCAVGTVRNARRVYVDFMDANPMYPISCWLNALSWAGVRTQIGAKASTAYNQTAYRGYFEFYVPATNVGYLTLTCQLPPSTSLLGWNTVTLQGE